MNKRSSRGERPRSARIRRRPSLPIVEEQDSDAANEEPRSSLQDAKKNDSQNKRESKRTIIPDGFKGMGVKNDFYGKPRESALSNRVTLDVVHIARRDTKNSFVKLSDRAGLVPPKSPRILPRLGKNLRKPLSNTGEDHDYDEPTASKDLSQQSLFQTTPTASAFLDQNQGKVNSGNAVQLGKHYSVLPDIATSKNGEEGSNVLFKFR